jgi:uncharacterized phiE125 gp8 family phage protein
MSDDVIIQPAALAVSMDEARRTARVDVDLDGTSPLDVDIMREVRTYTRDAEHKTNRAFITQTREVVLDAFPIGLRGGPGAIQLPKSPVASVVHVKFYDTDGIQQTLDPQDYQVDTKSKPGYVVPAPGKVWPATQSRILAVEVHYTCGYGPTDADVPDEAKSYILARVGQYFAPVANANESNFERLLDGLIVYL